MIMTMKNDESSRVKLATLVIDSWDMNDLYNYAHQALEQEYAQNLDLFNSDCEAMNELGVLEKS